MKLTFIALFGLSLACAGELHAADAPQRWSAEDAAAWGKKEGWLAGCNFTPSTAINQLEMWQADTFDPVTIDRELGWGEHLGFNSVRVFLHNLLWQQDSNGFLDRMDQFLVIAHKHHIKPMFVLFDSCWNPNPKLGKQPDPKPFVHNSGWVQSPGADYLAHPERLDELQPYVEGVVGHFRGDPRILFWDVFNEPDNMNDPAYIKIEPGNKKASALLLLKKVYAWARAAKPSQPLSSGVWMGNWSDPAKLSAIEQAQLDESDIITFHNYGRLEDVQPCVENLRRYHRPVICTEYMARPTGSTFDPVLRYFKEQNVGAYNWGFVSGKTQTIFPWDSWTKKYTAEPPLWFHDILRQDGTPYSEKEVAFIRSVTVNEANSISSNTFTNPVLPSGADPWAIYKDGFYYYMNSTGRNLTVWKTRSIPDLRTAEKTVVWRPPATGPFSKDIWAPEIHFLQNKWYIYFAADAGMNPTHRIWVIENPSADPTQGTWSMKGKLSDASDKWAIDASVFENKGRLYAIWSGWEGDSNGTQNIYIAAMKNPWTIEGSRSKVSSPTYTWETIGDLVPNKIRDDPAHVNVNEGPEILQHGDKLFLIYSASGCWTENYCLGMLTAFAGADLLDPASWEKSLQPVLSQRPDAQAYATGHCGFFKSPDGAEDWIVFHANPKPGEGCGSFRQPRAQPIIWRSDGTPDFGQPIPLATPIRRPSGEVHVP